MNHKNEIVLALKKAKKEYNVATEVRRKHEDLREKILCSRRADALRRGDPPAGEAGTCADGAASTAVPPSCEIRQMRSWRNACVSADIPSV